MVGNAGFPYTETNKPLGAARAAAYYHDADEANADYTAVADLAGVRFLRGVNCVDKASNPAQCEIWLETHPGAAAGSREVADVNAFALIVSGNDGVGNPLYIWEVQCQVVGADVFVVFSDAIGLEKGVAPTGVVYNNAGFIDGLGIFLVPTTTRMQWIKDNILFSNVDAGGITASDIPRAAGVSDVETDLATVETDWAVEHGAPGAGQHNAEIVTNPVLNVNAFAPDIDSYESGENLVDGDFEYDSDGDGVVDGWLPYLAPATVQLSNVQVIRGQWSQLVTTLGAGPGIHAAADWRLHYFVTDFQNKQVSCAVLVYAAANNSVDVTINDGVGTTTIAGGTAGAWDIIFVTRTMNAAANTCEFRITANQATTFYVGGVMAHLGRLNIGYVNAPAGTFQRLSETSDWKNALPNGDMKDWTNLWGGVAGSLPDWWTVSAGAPVIAQNAVTVRFGPYSLDATFALGDSIQINNPNPLDYAGQNCYVSFYYYGVAGPDVLQVTVDDGIIPLNFTIYPTIGTWNRFGVVFPIAGASVAQAVRITSTNLAGGQTLIDGAQMIRGFMPSAFTTSAILTPIKWDFVMVGAIAATNMTFHGSVLEAIVPSDTIVHRIMIYSTVAPGGAMVDTYDVLLNGAPAGIAGTVTGAANVGALHVPGGVAYVQGDRLQVGVTPGVGSAAADISAVVEGIRIGN